jgi:hypothetical protein
MKTNGLILVVWAFLGWYIEWILRGGCMALSFPLHLHFPSGALMYLLLRRNINRGDRESGCWKDLC